ncbi:MAG: NAD(P)-dependent oxidoreductase [Rhodobacteraceae bacterium]|nr:MAG: NAD(P)-dependent oxidoreductase [Paracoccaceae bacterium]
MRALTPGIAPSRLEESAYRAVFADAHPPMSPHEALVAADRCYFCHDAPCVAACPTAIDIPLFIRQIQAGLPEAAAKTIFDQNIFGGMCARVCPTETLCEGACVREAAEGAPVQIGLLQRYATDALMDRGTHPYRRAPDTGKRVAVVGAGPAGLACAHRLAVKGHAVTVYDARPKPGGLNEYGIAAYKTPEDFAAREVAWILGVGGVEIVAERRLGRDMTLDELRQDHDAVFLGVGLQGVNALGAKGEVLPGVRDAVDFIAELRQADDLAGLPIGRRIVVIGGGMTAIDVATQTRLLGAEDVTIVYRRGRERMGASRHEQEQAAAKGVRFKHNARPIRVVGDGAAHGVEFEYVEETADGLKGLGETFLLEADQVFKAIGQCFEPGPAPSLRLNLGKIAVDAEGRTSIPGVWAGGDCAAGGEDLTVTAVAQGRDAAESIHKTLMEA